MRRSDLQVTRLDEIEAIIRQCRVCRIAMVDGTQPYVVPVNFGYSLADGVLTLYIHGAIEGRKVEILKRNPSVCFEMDIEWGLVEGKNACDSGFSYASVIGFGQMQVVTDSAGKREALDHLMRHAVGRTDNVYAESTLAHTAVYRLEASEFTAKRRVHRAESE